MKSLNPAILFLSLCAISFTFSNADTPRTSVNKEIRITGTKVISALLLKWENHYQKTHANVSFKNSLSGNSSAIYGLDMRVADIALLSRPIYPYERYGIYERSWVYPQEIEVATGSINKLKQAPAYAIFVNEKNPIKSISLTQLDLIFGAQRGGGWKALSWDESIAHDTSKNIRFWNQIAILGDLGSKEIHTYGPANLGAGAISYFQFRVMHGGEMWNENLKEYAAYPKLMHDLALDEQGIAYGPVNYRVPHTKPIPVSEDSSTQPFDLTLSTLKNRTYPLFRAIYAYYTIDNEKTLITDDFGDPQVNEFLQFILSNEGQNCIEEEGSFISLPQTVINEVIKKLASKQIPPEHSILE